MYPFPLSNVIQCVYIHVQKYNDKPKNCVTGTHFYMKCSSKGEADSVWLSGYQCWKQYVLSPVAGCVTGRPAQPVRSLESSVS